MANQVENFEYVGQWIMPFGKHKGMSFSDLVEKEPEYARWLAGINKNVKVRIYLKLKLGMP